MGAPDLGGSGPALVRWRHRFPTDTTTQSALTTQTRARPLGVRKSLETNTRVQSLSAYMAPLRTL